MNRPAIHAFKWVGLIGLLYTLGFYSWALSHELWEHFVVLKKGFTYKELKSELHFVFLASSIQTSLFALLYLYCVNMLQREPSGERRIAELQSHSIAQLPSSCYSIVHLTVAGITCSFIGLLIAFCFLFTATKLSGIEEILFFILSLSLGISAALFVLIFRNAASIPPKG